MKYCKCGALLLIDWHKQCTACYAKAKRQENEAAIIALEEAKVEIARLKDLLRRQTPQPKIKSDLTQEQVRWLIQMCHPDKHNGSVMSTQITAWLIAQRR